MSTLGSVSADQVANPRSLAEAYHREGFAIARGIYSAEEVAMLAAECDTLLTRTELIDTQNIRCRWQNHATTGECTFDCFDPVIDIGPVARYFTASETLRTLLREIYGDEPQLFKDKLIFKRPGITGYDLHQDYISWPGFPESFLTVIIAIDATHRENGATEVFPGYHQQGYLSDRDGEYHNLAVEKIDESRGVILELEPGDVAIFSGFTPHRSAPNSSNSTRRQLYLSYNASRDGGDQRTAHYRFFHEWLVKKYAEYGKHGVFFR